jgi:hypothetical protein
VVDNITLAELVRRYHEKGNCEYFIWFDLIWFVFVNKKEI